MNSDDILKVLDLVHEVFPLPSEEETGLKGTHSLTKDKESGKLELNIWYLISNVPHLWFIRFDPNEEITRELLEEHGPTL